MATSRIILPISAAILPDGTGTVNNPAQPERVVSSGSQTLNTPKATYLQLLFDPTTDEHAMWSFTLPGDYVSDGSVRLKYTNKGTSTNQVVWKAATAIAVSGTTDLDAIVFDGAISLASTPNATTGIPVEVNITGLNMSNAAANRHMILMVGRDPDHASDTNASDMALVGVVFEYTS